MLSFRVFLSSPALSIFGLIVLVVGLQQVKVVDRVIHVILPHQIIGVLAVGDVQIDKSNTLIMACQCRLTRFCPSVSAFLAGDITISRILLLLFPAASSPALNHPTASPSV